jgi:hypothetical protein
MTRMKLVAVVISLVITCGASLDVDAQVPDPTNPTVPIVMAVGRVEMDAGSWFLTRATDPEATVTPFANSAGSASSESEDRFACSCVRAGFINRRVPN